MLLLCYFAFSPTSVNPSTNQVEFDNPSYGYPCLNVIITATSNGTLYTCPPTVSNVAKVFELPAPVYKRVKCVSTYGCSKPYGYEGIIPPNLISPEQKQVIVDRIISLNATKQNHGWKLDRFDIQPVEDKWRGHVQLVLPGIAQIPPSSGCGWHGLVSIDLETLEILNVDGIPPRSNVTC